MWRSAYDRVMEIYIFLSDIHNTTLVLSRVEFKLQCKYKDTTGSLFRRSVPFHDYILDIVELDWSWTTLKDQGRFFFFFAASGNLSCPHCAFKLYFCVINWRFVVKLYFCAVMLWRSCHSVLLFSSHVDWNVEKKKFWASLWHVFINSSVKRPLDGSMLNMAFSFERQPLWTGWSLEMMRSQLHSWCHQGDEEP